MGEMVCPWTTGMERVIVLRRLRAPLFSCALEPTKFQKEIELLKALLDHEPAQRPSADALMSMLPPVVHRPRLQDTLKLLTEDLVFRNDVLCHLFSTERALAEYVYDANRHGTTSSMAMATEHVINKIRCVFKVHGAIDRTAWMNNLYPLNSIYEDREHVVKLLDEHSNVLQLPYDFKVPFARQLARTEARIELDRSSIIGSVYRSINGHTKSLIEADFDLLQDEPSQRHNSGTETLRVLYEIVTELPFETNDFRIVLGHSELARAILRQARVPDRDYSKVLSMLVALTHNPKKRSLAHWNHALGDILPQSSILELIRFQPLPESTFEEEVDRIIAYLQESSSAIVSRVQNSLLEFRGFARTYGIHFATVFHAFISGHSFFDLTYTLESTLVPRTDIVAIGGSYTGLISSLRMPGSSLESIPNAFGFSLAVDKLARLYIDKVQNTSNLSQIDVIISTRTHETRALELATRLWDAEIPAELCFHEDTPTLCSRRHARILLSFRDKRSNTTNSVWIKVRQLLNNESEDVPFENIVQYLRAELSDLTRPQRKPIIPRLERSLTYKKEPELIFVGVDDQRKQKGSIRETVSAKALECTRSLSEQLEQSNIPVLVVELDAEHMQILRAFNPRAKDDAHAKRISDQMLGSMAKAHFANLRQAICKLQDAGKSNCLLYSYKCSELVLVPL